MSAERILEAATALWSEKGYAQSTMRELGRRLGMGASSLYFYFRSKEEIVQFLYRKLNEQALNDFRTDDRGETQLSVNFVRWLKLKLHRLEPHRSCLAALLREAVDPESDLSPFSSSSSDVLEGNLRFLQELVEREGDIGGPRAVAVARALWMLHISVLVYWMHDRTAEHRNTERLLEKMEGLLGFMPMLVRMAPADGVLSLISDLFEKPQAPAAVTEVAPPVPLKSYDVVVMGGGPIGLLYASFLKQMRPRTRLLVLDKQADCQHKIGESTLSGFCKALRTVGIRKEAMQRLFYPKNGLGFLHVEEGVRDLRDAPEYILETFDQTYQVERRVLDSLMMLNARRLGVDVIQGAVVSIPRSRLQENGSIVSYSIGGAEFGVQTSLLVDASGPAAVLARHLGLHSTEGLPFQTSSVWAYYQGIKPLAEYGGWPGTAQFPRDEYTQHVCFREGWMWYIPIVSWQHAPAANLQRMLDAVLRTGRGLPSRERLSEDYGCPVKSLVSIGISVRSDRDTAFRDDPQSVFDTYLKRYPAMRQVLQGGRLVSDPYGAGAYMSRQNYRGHARRVTGDGWLLIGDAAFFVDPLISPGLTGGTAQAYFAAQESARALDEGVCSAAMLAEYEAFNHRLQDALERDNELVYMSFNHPQALALVQRLQEIDARRHFNETGAREYTLADTNMWGILNPSYQSMQKAAWTILREAELRVDGSVPIEEQSARDYEPAVADLHRLLDEYVSNHADLTPYVRANKRS